MELIDGRTLAEKYKDEIVKDVLKLNNDRPNLAIILVGEREDSKIYVRLKCEEANKVGIDTHLYNCDSEISENELLEMVKFLNIDDEIDAILIQLPLPKNIDTDKIINSISPEKDVDGFHQDNILKLKNLSSKDEIVSPVYKTVIAMLDSINFKIAEKKFLVIANSETFGSPLTDILKNLGGQAEWTKADDKNFLKKTRKADVIITAVGKPHFIKDEMIKDDTIIIDIGISKVNGKTLGDVDPDSVEKKVKFLTPVPGGVGPMTIAMALKNTLDLYKKRKGIK